MHPAAREWVKAHLAGPYSSTLEVGSLDINGGVRDLIDTRAYLGIDLVAGPGVDRVCDIRDYETFGQFDLVICCEVLEHDPEPGVVIDHLGRCCRPGGTVIATAGGPGRAPHSKFDGGHLRDGEHYGNLDEHDLNVAWGEIVASEIADTDWRVVWRKLGP